MGAKMSNNITVYRNNAKPSSIVPVGDGLLLKRPPSPKEHICKKPGFFKRWKSKVNWGDLWQCNFCNSIWEYHYDYAWPFWLKASQFQWDRLEKEVESQ